MSALKVTEREPAVIRGIVVSILTVLAALGLSWAGAVDDETVDAIVLLIGAAAPVLATVWARFKVTPTAKVVARVTTTGDLITGEAADAGPGYLVPPDVDTFGRPVVTAVSVRPDLVREPMID